MKAYAYTGNGPARDVLRRHELPVGEPGPDEVRVRVVVSAVNPSDTKNRQGTGPRPNPWPLVVPHQDGAGVIEAVGEGVNPQRIGQRVWLHECQFGRPFGTAAEQIVVPQRLALPLPDGVSFDVGATLGIPALTAWFCTQRVDAGPGRRVLVHGAAGAVGYYAAQMAQLRGAQVLGTVSNAQQAALLAQAGVTTVQRGPDIVSGARAFLTQHGGEGFDAVIDVDFAANFAVNLELLNNGGHLASYSSDADLTPSLAVRQCMHRNLQLSFLLVYTMPAPLKAQGAEQINRWLRDGALHVPQIHAYPFDAVADAHEAVETRRHVGKVVVRITDDQ